MAQAIKIVVANCCLKEVAKHEGDSHRYIFQCKTPEFQHSLTFQQIVPHEEKEIICSRD